MARYKVSTASTEYSEVLAGAWPHVLTRCRTASHTASSIGQKPQDLLVCLFGSMPATEAQQEDLWPREGEQGHEPVGQGQIWAVCFKLRDWFMVNGSLKSLK